MKIEIYGASWCDYCQRAKMLCNMKQLDIDYHDVDDEHVKQAMIERMPTPPTTIPQIFINGEYLPGGYTGLIEYFDKKTA